MNFFVLFNSLILSTFVYHFKLLIMMYYMNIFHAVLKLVCVVYKFTMYNYTDVNRSSHSLKSTMYNTACFKL